LAYDDSPLPIQEDQTISQPYMVAFMIEAARLQGGERVLEIGTGSGYAAAILAEIVGQVFSMERLPSLADSARNTLAKIGYANIQIHCGDGTCGLPDQQPFDAILVAAGGPRVPESLKRQLCLGGRLIIPVGDNRNHQKLLRVTRHSESSYATEEIASVRFVPLIGGEGWGSGVEEMDVGTPGSQDEKRE